MLEALQGRTRSRTHAAASPSVAPTNTGLPGRASNSVRRANSPWRENTIRDARRPVTSGVLPSERSRSVGCDSSASCHTDGPTETPSHSPSPTSSPSTLRTCSLAPTRAEPAGTRAGEVVHAALTRDLDDLETAFGGLEPDVREPVVGQAHRVHVQDAAEPEKLLVVEHRHAQDRTAQRATVHVRAVPDDVRIPAGRGALLDSQWVERVRPRRQSNDRQHVGEGGARGAPVRDHEEVDVARAEGAPPRARVEDRAPRSLPRSSAHTPAR